ncbi:aminotransferase class V-fold PLP-dependent enzyme [Labilibaculum sp.]|uniref:aminotransferase class V-fold PLP-dependent enzyme n=1 Tax=Labilibaculum sp. TaxID=2060723 RepID=UPI002AA91AFF|nr:aminotransferase class V-fold PLP-dependent enzyme [Labilibaculum sp.]
MPDNISEGVNEILNSGQLAYGVHTRQFEDKLRSFVGNPSLLTVSGNSVFFALKLIGIQEGDEVIASPMACLATNQPVAYAGAKIVWADIDPLTASLDPEDVKMKITPKTKAIIHYHWSGYPGYIDEINAIAKEKGIYVIEDASESFGAEYKGKILGNTNTDIVCYSFTPVRLPNAIDGGGLAFNDKALFDMACLMRDYGIDRSKFRDDLGEISDLCDISTAGDACAMNNLSGYIGSQQMDYIANLYVKQRQNAINWMDYFSDNGDISVLNLRGEINPSYWSYTILSDKRDDLLNDFRQKGYYASKMHLRNDLYSVFKTGIQNFIGLNEFSGKQLNLPCGWWIDDIKMGL